MRELDRIRKALAAAAARGDAVLLATVLGVEGSVYRGAGARMLVTADGNTVCAVSGGCLEADIVARAPDVLAANRNEVVRYDTRASDDDIVGLGLGCQGIIDLLLEPLAGAALQDAVAFFDRLVSHRDRVTVLTLQRSHAGGPPVGSRLLLDEHGSIIEGDASLLALESDLAREIVRPAIPLVICGGGADAIPLVTLAKLMGWHVTVIDHRASFASASRFPEADVVINVNLTQDPGALAGRLLLDGRTAAVVMAHSAAHDRAYLHVMRDAGASYIGVLGPRRRTNELMGDGAGGSDRALPPHVYAPVGLDLGAESPEDIALAIVAEVAAVNVGRMGGHMRDRSGPIHGTENRSSLPSSIAAGTIQPD